VSEEACTLALGATASFTRVLYLFSKQHLEHVQREQRADDKREQLADEESARAHSTAGHRPVSTPKRSPSAFNFVSQMTSPMSDQALQHAVLAEYSPHNSRSTSDVSALHLLSSLPTRALQKPFKLSGLLGALLILRADLTQEDAGDALKLLVSGLQPTLTATSDNSSDYPTTPASPASGLKPFLTAATLLAPGLGRTINVVPVVQPPILQALAPTMSAHRIANKIRSMSGSYPLNILLAEDNASETTRHKAHTYTHTQHTQSQTSVGIH